MDFWRTIFTVILYLNIPMAIASFFFAYILLRRAKGDVIYFNFGMSTLFLGLWIVLTLFNFLPVKIENYPRLFFNNLTYFTGIWVLHFFTLFTIYYPVKSFKSKLPILSLYAATLIISFSAFISGLYTRKVFFDSPFLYLDINVFGLTIFTLYFLFLVVIAFINLFTKYQSYGGIFKRNIRLITIGTFIAVVANLIFSLGIYFFLPFQANPIGILFSFAVLAYIYSILYQRYSKWIR